MPFVTLYHKPWAHTAAEDLVDQWPDYVPDGVILEVTTIPGSEAASFDLEVHPALRGQGLAKLALSRLAKLADLLQVELVILARPQNWDVNLRDLKRLYRSVGFITTQGNFMRRLPNGTPRS